MLRELKIIEMRKAIKKAREEYHSFMRVRELKDIGSSCALTATMLRLENKLVDAVTRLARLISRIKKGAVA